MRAPRGTGTIASSGSLATPALIVVLVIMFGATVYLWRARYIRRRTAYVTMAALVVALAAVAAWMYWYPMQGT